SIQDVQGTPLGAFSGTLTIDTSPPRITATSVAPGGIASPGSLSYQVTFSKPMKVSNLSSDDFSLQGTSISYSAASSSFKPAGTVLTLNYANLPEDIYTLRLVAGTTGGTNFTDPVGNALDGEFSGAFPSGDGFAGGNFVAGFSLDITTLPFPTPLTAKLPLDSLIYDQVATGLIGPVGDSDSFTLGLDA